MIVVKKYKDGGKFSIKDLPRFLAEGGKVTGDPEKEEGEYFVDSEGNRITVNVPEAEVEAPAGSPDIVEEIENLPDVLKFTIYNKLMETGKTSWGLPTYGNDPSSAVEYEIPTSSVVKRDLKEGEEYTDAMRLEDELNAIKKFMEEENIGGYFDPKYYDRPTTNWMGFNVSDHPYK